MFIGQLLASWARQEATTNGEKAVYSTIATLFSGALAVTQVKTLVQNAKVAQADLTTLVVEGRERLAETADPKAA